MLGTWTPAPNPDRWGPATAVVVDGRAYIFDAGVGVVRQFVAAQVASDLDVFPSG
ncbi:MAG: hypothetical protein HKN72_02465 [Gemmatimonadetes bacterium]|nr:hypothetical protein [Gemmatimonadota bacterium]